MAVVRLLHVTGLFTSLVFVHRYHLQALRHLYVLAAEPRLLVPVDVDTNTPCYALIEVTYKVTNFPCHLCRSDYFKSILAKGDDTKLNSHKTLSFLSCCSLPERLTLVFLCNFWHYQLFLCP